jgi:hypothetical protein
VIGAAGSADHRPDISCSLLAAIEAEVVTGGEARRGPPGSAGRLDPGDDVAPLQPAVARAATAAARRRENIRGTLAQRGGSG